MSHEAVERVRSRVQVSEGDHRGGGGPAHRRKEKGKLVHEVADSWCRAWSTVINPGRQELLLDFQGLAEVFDLIGFGFEVVVLAILENKAEAQEPGRDMVK